MNHPDRSALNARNSLLAMLLLLCVLDITLVTIARDWWAIGRILPTIVVMYFVMQGQKWAKWLLMSICSLLVVILITMVIALSSKLSTVLIVGSVIMAILSAIIAIYLVSSKDLNRYFVLKRQASSR
jgi:membrane-associated HD superfamily phosphohydrolase